VEQRIYTATQADTGRRLDALLPEKYADFSRSQVQKAIKQGMITVNGKRPKPSHAVAAGDGIVIIVPEPEPAVAEAQDIPLDILHEDDDVIVINKPSGMVVHPACGNHSGTLVNALLHHCTNLSGIGGVIRPGIVHRLDKGTTGVLVAAKNDAAHRHLSGQFKLHSVIRKYTALVYGAMAGDQGTIEGAIGRHVADRKKMSVHTNRGRAAVTHWRVLESFTGVTLLEASLETGRTHQVRVHLSSQQHPVVGDDLYGADKKLKQIASKRLLDLLRSVRRPLLHAYHLTFVHPVTSRVMTFEAPLPEDFGGILAGIRGLHA
jgi:23S rRNA pseudouridine1911/1915/1917 synthase